MSRLAQAADRLGSRLFNRAGEECVYRAVIDGITEEVTLTAVAIRDVHQVEDRDGAVVEIESWDFLLAAADLVLAGEMRLPARGQKVRRTVDGQVLEYEVNDQFGDHVYRFLDPSRKLLRVHTKFVGEVA